MKKEKVLLIDPFCKNPKYESPNAKLGYSSAILEEAGIETKILDFIIPDIEKINRLEEYEKMRADFNKTIKRESEENK